MQLSVEGGANHSAAVATYLAAFKNYDDVLAPGEAGTLMVIAADRRQARVIFNYVSAFFESSSLLKSMVASRLKESITLTNRVVIEIHTCSFKATRGYTLIGAIADELAFWSSEDSANPDVEVLNALRPGLAPTNGLLLGISSPYASRGAFWQAFRDHYGKTSDVLVWKASSKQMNSTLSPAVIKAAYLRDAAVANAEFGGEFRTDVEGFVPLGVLEQCVMCGRLELPPLSGVSYSAFVDPSGGSSDSFTLAIAHSEHERTVLDLLREVQPPFSPESVVREFVDALKRYGISGVTGDRYGGEWPREQFQKRGISYTVSEHTKSELYLELLPLLTSGRVELLDHRRLNTQLAGLERRTARGGRDLIDHGPGAHDDCANVVAGAMVLAAREAGQYGLLDLARKVIAGDLKIAAPPPRLNRRAEIARLVHPRPPRTTAAALPSSEKPATSKEPCECGATLWQTIPNGRRCGACARQYVTSSYITVTRGPFGPVFVERKFK